MDGNVLNGTLHEDNVPSSDDDYEDELTPLVIKSPGKLYALTRLVKDHIASEDEVHRKLVERIDQLAETTQKQHAEVRELIEWAVGAKTAVKLLAGLGKVVLFLLTLCGAAFGTLKFFSPKE